MKLVVAILVALAAQPALAADLPPGGGTIARSLAACRVIADDSARLACFDKAAGAFVQAVEKKDIRIIDKQEVKTTRRSLFGFALPKIGLFSDDEADSDEQKAAREIDTTIAQIRELGNDKYDLRMADASTWRTTETLNVTPKTGAAVHIQRAMLGSYFLRVGKGRTIRAMRIQ